jgi:hypothetical protein
VCLAVQPSTDAREIVVSFVWHGFCSCCCRTTEQETEEAQMTKRLTAVMVATVCLIGGAARAEPRVELETFLGIGSPGFGGGGAIGVPIGGHLVLMTGVAGQGGGDDGYASYWVRVPAELKLYMVRPRAGGLVPQLRLGAAYVRTGTEITGVTLKGSGVEGLGSLGVSYMISERFGVSSEVGLTYGRYHQANDGVGVLGVAGAVGGVVAVEGWRLGLDWRLGVVFRI